MSAPARDLSYFERQVETPYASTVAFSDFLVDYLGEAASAPERVLDVCCGMGEVAFYLVRRFPRWHLAGVDRDTALVAKGRAAARRLGVDVSLDVGDALALGEPGRWDGVVSLQTLSLFPDWRGPVQEMCRLRPRWVAASVLLYDGEVDCDVRVRDRTRPGAEGEVWHHYNVYSVPDVARGLTSLGYRLAACRPFEIPIDLPPPAGGGLGTRTVRIEGGGRLQLSGPLLLPWHFILIERIDR